MENERLLKERFERLIIEDAQYKKLLRRYKDLLLKRNFVLSGETLSELKRYKELAFENFKNRTYTEKIQLGEITSQLSMEDKHNCALWVNTIMLLADWTELLTMRVNETIRKTSPDVRLEMYNKLIALGKAAKEQVSFMGKVTSMDFQISFAEKSEPTLEGLLNEVSNWMKEIDHEN